MRKLLILTAVATLLGFATVANATLEESFVAIDTAAGVQTPSTVSTVTSNTVTLIQDGRESAIHGTSAETPNLNIEVNNGDVLEVDYSLEDGATAAAGSTRLFVYYSPNADTWNILPDQKVDVPHSEVEGDSGTLAITLDGGTIGTAGVVYDTSNSLLVGKVVFTNLRLNGESIPFLVPVVDEEEEEEEPDPEPEEDEEQEEEVTPVPVPTSVPAGQ